MQTILFDVDGVLIQGWHADSARRRPWDLHLFEDLGVDRAAFQHAFFGSKGEDGLSRMQRCVSGQQDLAEALADVLPQLGFQRQVEDFIGYWLAKDSHIDREVWQVAERLSAHPEAVLHVATGQEHRRAAYLWDELGFSRLFDTLFYSADLGVLKTDPAFFERINARLRLGLDDPPPLFFDDQAHIVAEARKAGWEAVQFAGIGDLVGHSKVQTLLGN